MYRRLTVLPFELPVRARNLIDSMLARSPAQSIIAAKTSSRLVVIAYHNVVDEENFRVQIEYLQRTKRLLSLTQVLDGLRGDAALPSNAVLITFDDADRTICERAHPVLKDYGVPAVAFVIAGHLDSEAPFWWREVEELIRRGGRTTGLSAKQDAAVRSLKEMPDRERRRKIRTLRRSLATERVSTEHLMKMELPTLEAAGVSIGNHTLTHPVLDRCSDRQVKSEIVRAHRILTEATGVEPRAFAYPNGNYDPRGAAVLKELGYEAAFLFDHRVAYFPPEDAFRISRVRVNSTTPLSRFRLIVNGVHPAMHRAIGRS